MGRRDDVDDVVSEVYASVWRRLDDALAADKPLAWIYGVAYRTLGNQQRSTSRALRLVTKVQAQPIASPSDPGRIVEQNDSAERTAAAVGQALQELSPVDAEIVRLSVWESMPQAEIAAIVGLEPGLVRSRLYRSRQKLERALRPRDIGQEPDTNLPTRRGRKSTDEAEGGPS